MKVIAALTVLFTSGVVALATLAGGGPPSAGGPAATPGSAVADIPGELLGVYVAAAGSCPGLPWTVLAAIGHSESRHAQGRADPATGDVEPPILGPALDGRPGFARIPDPTSADGWAHAQGPMQFLPSTWRTWGRLAPGRPAGATPSPHNAWDAIWSAAALLCGPTAESATFEPRSSRTTTATATSTRCSPRRPSTKRLPELWLRRPPSEG